MRSGILGNGMNSLQRFLDESGVDEVKSMNLLQTNGIISDLAVWAEDVAEVDCQRAIDFLKSLT